jgi:hypothetical protein
MTSKHLKLYSAQKHAELGNGYYSKAVSVNTPNYEEVVKEIRANQKKENAEFKQKKARGEVIELKFKKVEPPIFSSVPVNAGPPDINKIEIIQPPLVVDRFAKTPFKLLLDPHTGNTTFVLGGSKYGKSTALMKIYDQYYSDKNFISILWTVNPQIQLYKGHRKLLKAGVWNLESEEVIKDQKRIQTKTKNHYKFLNIFDDVINVKNNALMDNMILTYRNSKMSSIISLQYSNLMSKCSRANCNNILAFGFNTDESIEVVIKTFLTGYLKKIGITKLPDQINWYKDRTADHSFIYIKPSEGIVSFHKFTI